MLLATPPRQLRPPACHAAAYRSPEDDFQTPIQATPPRRILFNFTERVIESHRKRYNEDLYRLPPADLLRMNHDLNSLKAQTSAEIAKSPEEHHNNITDQAMSFMGHITQLYRRTL